MDDVKQLTNVIDELGNTVAGGLSILAGDMTAIKNKLDSGHPVGPDFSAAIQRIRDLSATTKASFGAIHTAALAVEAKEDEVLPQDPIPPVVVPPVVVPPVETAPPVDTVPPVEVPGETVPPPV